MNATSILDQPHPIIAKKQAENGFKRFIVFDFAAKIQGRIKIAAVGFCNTNPCIPYSLLTSHPDVPWGSSRVPTTRTFFGEDYVTSQKANSPQESSLSPSSRTERPRTPVEPLPSQ